MSWPEPKQGMVIRYSYLWQNEATQGREEGSKDRPCAVVLVVKDQIGRKRLQVLPVTHATPIDPSTAIELPQITKERLHLDSERSWVVVSELNEFVWPGPDLRPRVNGDLSTIVYGMLPPGLFKIIRDRYLALDAARRLAKVKRTN